jgi:acyl dehydratase
MSRRTFDSVSVGDTFGPTEVAVERETLVAYANASGDQNPIHQNGAFAKSVGLPDVIAHGMWTMGATSSVLVEWAGDPGAVLDIGTRFTKPVVVPADGSAVTVTGVVKSADEETRSVLVDLTTVCGEDKVLGRCQARVTLA